MKQFLLISICVFWSVPSAAQISAIRAEVPESPVWSGTDGFNQIETPFSLNPFRYGNATTATDGPPSQGVKLSSFADPEQSLLQVHRANAVTQPAAGQSPVTGSSGTGGHSALPLAVLGPCHHIQNGQPRACSSVPNSTGFGAWRKGVWQITPYGFLSGEAIAADAAITARSFVLYVNESIGEAERQFTPHGQTTGLGFNLKGPTVGAFQSGGSILFNFLGDRPVLNQSSPLLLRAYGELNNEEWRFGFGVAPDIFGPQTPRTVNFGGHIQAGNIAAFRGQLRADRFIQLSEDVRWTTSAAISQQVVSDFASDPLTIGTDNGWPNLEGRMLLAIGSKGTANAPLQLGVSGIIGETRALALSGTNVSASWGISTDAQIIGDRFGARYELFAGQAIGTYNAGIGQSLNPENGEPIATVGGFAEAWVNLHKSVSWHIGLGVDNPNNDDLGRTVDPILGPLSGQRSRNLVAWTNVFLDVTDAFEVGFEVSHRETNYIAPGVSNEAMIYHFRARLKF